MAYLPSKYSHFYSIRNFRSILFIACLFSLFGCQQKKQNVQEITIPLTYAPPKTVVVRQPVPVLLNVSPKSIGVPVKPFSYTIQTKAGKEARTLLPPSTTILPVGMAQGHANFTTYTTDNGLALDAISCSNIDHFGNIWFGTYGGGVSKYDGKSFTTYTTVQGLANNTVWSTLEDKMGNLWFGTNGGGVSKYDGKSFTTYTTAQGLANNNVWSMLEDKAGNIWFGTYGGVSKYDGKSFTSYTTVQGLASNIVWSVLEDQVGNLWFGTNGEGVSKYDGKVFTNYTTEQGLANNTVQSSIEDKMGNLWFGTAGGGVSKYDGKVFTNYTTAQGLANNTVQSIIRDKSGNIWFGTFGGGVSKYDGKSFTNYTTAQGLANNNVKSILEDKTGSLWFGTYGGGVSKYDGEPFTSYTTEQGLANNNVRSILEDKTGNLWFGTYGGVSKYDGKSFTSYTAAQGLPNNGVLSMLEDKAENIWFGTYQGVSKYDGKSFTSYTTEQGLANNNVRSMLEDKTGNLWFGTAGGGVSKYDGKSFTNYTTAQGLANDNVLCILEDKTGNLWFGTYEGGVTRYDGKSFTNYTTEQGLANNTVRSMQEDKTGNIWFGTYGGISKYDGKSFTNYTTVQGLPDNTVASIILSPTLLPIEKGEKRGDCLIIGTNQGIAVLIGWKGKDGKVLPFGDDLGGGTKEEVKSYIPVFEIYNSHTGYPVKDVNGGSNNGAMLYDSKGIIWAGTGSEKTNLVRFDPSAVFRNPNPPIVVIQSVRINEENICWYTALSPSKGDKYGNTAKIPPSGYSFGAADSATIAQNEVMTLGKVLTAQERDTMRSKFSGIQFDGITRFYPLPEHLVLPYQYNHITFEFTAIETTKPYLMNYQYMLENYDKKWNRVTDKTNATFGNIYEGTYTFKLKAQSSEGVWSEPILYTFKVLPPWYRSWLAYSIYVILLIAAITAIVFLNGKRLQVRANYLQERVDEVTIEIREKNKILEGKNKNIIDSINYAKMIQVALLKEEERVSMHLPDHFIVFKPRDIVSGDFYWALEKEGYFYFAAVDCTGHGVPGGFLSMLGVAFLNEITASSEILSPAEVLNRLRDKITKELKQKEEDIESHDGMDMSLIRLDLNMNELQWSGANNPLWYLQNGELKEVVPDKQPVRYYQLMKPFTNHVIKIEKDDLFYLFTDGYADQFGGTKGKKFGSSQLKEMLLSIHKKPMIEQKQILKETFENWKGTLMQVDDVLVIGVRV